MPALSRTERADLCDLALQVGQDEPTLCGDWTVKELVAHLIVREGNPAAVGVVVPPLSRVTDMAIRRTAAQDFTVLVERLRQGPPFYSPYRVPRIDKMFNTIEFFVHHEDIRRAQPAWEPRTLSEHAQRVLWKQVGVGGKGLVRNAKVGVVLENSETGQRVTLRESSPSVVVRGLPSELTLMVYGRVGQAHVEYDGSPEDVATLRGGSLGI